MYHTLKVKQYFGLSILLINISTILIIIKDSFNFHVTILKLHYDIVQWSENY